MHKVQAARSRETSVGTDTTSELLLHFSTPLDLTVTAARVLQSKLVLKGRISIRSTCKFLDYTVVGCLRCTYYGDAAACATVSKSRGLFQYFEICFKISAADTCDCETVISLHPQRSESQTGVHRVSWLTNSWTVMLVLGPCRREDGSVNTRSHWGLKRDIVFYFHHPAVSSCPRCAPPSVHPAPPQSLHSWLVSTSQQESLLDELGPRGSQVRGQRVTWLVAISHFSMLLIDPHSIVL